MVALELSYNYPFNSVNSVKVILHRPVFINILQPTNLLRLLKLVLLIPTDLFIK